MGDTEFLRSDELPGRRRARLPRDRRPAGRTCSTCRCAATVTAGIYSTAADIRSFWEALFAGRIVPPERVAEMVRPRSDVPEDARRYGLGFWLHASSDVVMLEGYDAGVSFRSMHDPASGPPATVIAERPRARGRSRSSWRDAW